MYWKMDCGNQYAYFANEIVASFLHSKQYRNSGLYFTPNQPTRSTYWFEVHQEKVKNFEFLHLWMDESSSVQNKNFFIKKK